MYLLRFISLAVVLVFPVCKSQFDFGSLFDFELTSDVTFPSKGDDVTLTCRRTERYQRKIEQNFIDEEDQLSWEMNSRPLLATRREQDGSCSVVPDSTFLGRSSFNQNRPSTLPNVTCVDDGNEVKLTIHQWSPTQMIGDSWRCVQFPFSESVTLTIQSFVPVAQVSIKQFIEKNTPYQSSRGTFVTCKTSPARPKASIDWFAQTDNGDVQIISLGNLQEQVGTTRDGLSMTTATLLFTADSDHGIGVYCTATNRQGQTAIQSQNISLIIKYPPRASIRASPSLSVIEATDVVLQCLTSGRPAPQLAWYRKLQGSTAKEDILISRSATVTFTSVGLSDSGEYVCIASNGLEPDASDSAVLFVREKPAVQNPADTKVASSSKNPVDSDSSGDTSAGAIAGGVIAAILIICLIVVVVLLVLRHRRKKKAITEHSARHRDWEESDGQGVYATCSTLPRTGDVYPPYLEILPPSGTTDRKMSKINNPNYGMDDAIIGGVRASRKANLNRPLPNTPLDCDSGYEEIDDANVLVTQQNDRMRFEDSNPHYENEVSRSKTLPHGHRPHMRNGVGRVVMLDDGYEVPVNPRSLSSGDLPTWNRRYSNVPHGSANIGPRDRSSEVVLGPKSSKNRKNSTTMNAKGSFYANDKEDDTSF